MFRVQWYKRKQGPSTNRFTRVRWGQSLSASWNRSLGTFQVWKSKLLRMEQVTCTFLQPPVLYLNRVSWVQTSVFLDNASPPSKPHPVEKDKSMSVVPSSLFSISFGAYCWAPAKRQPWLCGVRCRSLPSPGGLDFTSFTDFHIKLVASGKSRRGATCYHSHRLLSPPLPSLRVLTIWISTKRSSPSTETLLWRKVGLLPLWFNPYDLEQATNL